MTAVLGGLMIAGVVAVDLLAGTGVAFIAAGMAVLGYALACVDEAKDRRG